MDKIDKTDLKIHINDMKSQAECLMMDSKQLEVRANEIRKQAIRLENEFLNN